MMNAHRFTHFRRQSNVEKIMELSRGIKLTDATIKSSGMSLLLQIILMELLLITLRKSRYNA